MVSLNSNLNPSYCKSSIIIRYMAADFASCCVSLYYIILCFYLSCQQFGHRPACFLFCFPALIFSYVSCHTSILANVFDGCPDCFLFCFPVLLCSVTKNGEGNMLYRPKILVSVCPSVRQRFHHSCPLNNCDTIRDIFTKLHANVKYYKTRRATLVNLLFFTRTQ